MSTVSDGVRVGMAAVSSSDKVRNVAANVAGYINLKEAGHAVYGWAYVAAQVNSLNYL